MTPPARLPGAETTALPAAHRGGAAGAASDLFVRVYAELRRLSQAYLAAEPCGATLSATGLVHEAYLKLVPGGDWSDRAHFMAVAARAMRQVLIDRARARKAHKRGSGARAVTLDFDLLGAGTPAGEHDAAERLLAIDEALEQLWRRNEQLGRLVELRFFGGLEVGEAAAVLGISDRTAARYWTRARAHLLAELT